MSGDDLDGKGSGAGVTFMISTMACVSTWSDAGTLVFGRSPAMNCQIW